MSVPNETAPRSPDPHPPPPPPPTSIFVPAQSMSPAILLDRLKFQIFGLGNFKSCDLITKISITIHVSNVHTFKKGSAITQNPNV